jgi:organic hydroperoxide reductase OsmC/OhrA
MTKNEFGKYWISEVTLYPKIVFIGEKLPDLSEIKNLHDQAHHECFIANSVKSDIRVDLEEQTR